MGKGHRRRSSNISVEEYARNYDRIFKGVEPEIPTTTQVECTAIVKYVPPDLTKMDHPTACKYLVEGMKVKVLNESKSYEQGWYGIWNSRMTDYVGKIVTIETIDTFTGRGVVFVEDPIKWNFPAFCLQIIKPGSEDGDGSSEVV